LQGSALWRLPLDDGVHAPCSTALDVGRIPRRLRISFKASNQSVPTAAVRTAANPLRSRASWPLTLTTIAVVAVGVALPFTPVAELLGFVPLPATFFAFLVAVTLTYLVLVEVVKRWLLGRQNVTAIGERQPHGLKRGATTLARPSGRRRMVRFARIRRRR
jgi:hypothetical protein